jgi:mono/diheme cytochrome c family protein
MRLRADFCSWRKWLHRVRRMGLRAVSDRVHQAAAAEAAPAGAVAVAEHAAALRSSRARLQSPDVLARGKAVYETNCSSCHAIGPARRAAPGPQPAALARCALNDQHGELVGAELLKHAAPITLSGGDPVAVAEYISTACWRPAAAQGGPAQSARRVGPEHPRGRPEGGRSLRGKANCLSCHSLTGDLKGIAIADFRIRAASRAPGFRARRAAAAGRGGGGGRGGAGGGTGTVTFKDGTTLEGRITRKDDFLVVIVRWPTARANRSPGSTANRRSTSSIRRPRTRRWS